jgi:Virulence-associated protein E
MSSKFEYSKGLHTRDNLPKQHSVDTFQDFTDHVLRDRSSAKGGIYFCCALGFGPHDDVEKFKNPNHYRLANLAQKKRFLSLDFDEFRDVETFERVLLTLKNFKGIGYTTWSHSEEKPRLRGILELNSDVDRKEAITLGKNFEKYLIEKHGEGSIKLDNSVFRSEQPIYGPPLDAKTFDFEGTVLDVNDFLNNQETQQPPNKPIEDELNIYNKLSIKSLETVLSKVDCSDEPTWSDVASILARVYGKEGRQFFIKYSNGYYANENYSNFDIREVNLRFDRALREAKIRPTGFGIKKLCSIAKVSTQNLDFEHDTKEITFNFISKKGKPEQVTENLESVLDYLHIIVRYNQIRKRSEIIIPNFQCILDEYDNTTLTKVTDEAVKAGLSPSRIDEFINSIASKNLFCPVRTYIESASWDGQDYLEQFYSQIKSSDERMTRMLFRKWFIQSVAAVYEENGISGSGVIVLTGAQGVGKTRLFKDITRDISSVFLEGAILNPSDKDSVMNVCSNWIVELGELDATFRKSDLAQLKGFLTKNKDSLRRPYARKESSFARRTVFAGTVNDFHFLHDRTGNRRFWPVDILSIDRDRSINYQQLWAQIKTFYVAEESWHLSPEEMKQVTEYSEQFLLNDLALEKLMEVYTFHEASDWEAKTMNDICKAISLDYPTLGDMQKLASTIKRLNGNKLPKKVNGINHHWVPKTFIGVPFSNTAKTLGNINEWLESKV